MSLLILISRFSVAFLLRSVQISLMLSSNCHSFWFGYHLLLFSPERALLYIDIICLNSYGVVGARFQTTETKMRRKMWIQNMKIKLNIMGIIVALIFIILNWFSMDFFVSRKMMWNCFWLHRWISFLYSVKFSLSPHWFVTVNCDCLNYCLGCSDTHLLNDFAVNHGGSGH